MKLKSIPRSLGYILGAQWTRDLAWTAFTILLARRSPDILGQVVLALTFGYLVKTVADVGLNDFLLSTFARREGRPVALLGEVTAQADRVVSGSWSNVAGDWLAELHSRAAACGHVHCRWSWA